MWRPSGWPERISDSNPASAAVSRASTSDAAPAPSRPAGRCPAPCPFRVNRPAFSVAIDDEPPQPAAAGTAARPSRLPCHHLAVVFVDDRQVLGDLGRRPLFSPRGAAHFAASRRARRGDELLDRRPVVRDRRLELSHGAAHGSTTSSLHRAPTFPYVEIFRRPGPAVVVQKGLPKTVLEHRGRPCGRICARDQKGRSAGGHEPVLDATVRQRLQRRLSEARGPPADIPGPPAHR